jgi:serine/threonine protein kinase
MTFTSELKLGHPLGGGGFGDVVHGIDPVHGPVAVKVLRRRKNETAAEWAARSEDLLKEAQRLKSASHDNVVTVLNVVRDAATNVVHMVTELCDGGSLHDEFEAGPMPLDTVKNALTQVARGLGHIHSKKMIHRDIKPGNILKHGKFFKVGDFGLVTDKLIFDYASDQGYLDHLAPEVHRDRVTSARTDIWAFGMTAYRLLHGREFYDEWLQGKDIPALVIKGGFARNLPWLPHIPEPWRKFLRCAMHDDSAYRHASCHDWAQALAALPVTPYWRCQYAADAVDWSAPVGARLVQVALRIHSPRKHEWWAERTGGSKRTVAVGGGRGRIVTLRQADRELTDFFAQSS